MSKHDDMSLSKAAFFNKKYEQHLKKETRRKQLQSAQKNIKRNHQPKRKRRKNWIPDTIDDWDDLDYEYEDRVMPRGEQERRRSIERVAEQPASAKSAQLETPESQTQQGLVIQVSKGICQVDTGGRVLSCHIRGTLQAQESAFTNVVAVGDEVTISENGSGSGAVEAILPRRSVLVRPDVFHSHLQQVIVANADQLLIVASWREPAIWLELLDRYLIAAERNNLPALICINKVDLVDDEAEFQTTLRPYRELGYRVIVTSALTGEGIDELRHQLQQQTTVLSGLSGVGKSSLLNVVQPDLQLRVGEISDYHNEGQHTTTQVSLIRLDATSAVVDTPGIRQFGLSGLQRHELSRFFREIAGAGSHCRFANCTHLTEPDCAVQAAVAAGSITASRYHSYRQIYESL